MGRLVPWRGGLRVPSAESGSTGRCLPAVSSLPQPLAIWETAGVRPRAVGSQVRSWGPRQCQAGHNKSRTWGRAGRRGRRAWRGAAESSRSRHWPPATGGRSQAASERNKRPARPAPAAHTSIEGSGAPGTRSAARALARSPPPSQLSPPSCRPRPAPPRCTPRPRAKKVCAASEGRRGERARGVPSRPARPRPARGERPEPRRRRLARARAPRPSARHGRRGPQPAARVLPPASGDAAPPGRRLQLLPGAPATGVLQCRYR